MVIWEIPVYPLGGPGGLPRWGLRDILDRVIAGRLTLINRKGDRKDIGGCCKWDIPVENREEVRSDSFPTDLRHGSFP